MTEMKQQILGLIREYVKSGRELDEDYISRLFHILVSCQRLEKYFKIEDFLYDNTLSSTAQYFIKEKTLKINRNLLSLELEDYIKALAADGIETAYLPFTYLAEILVHESEHAAQIRELDNPNDSVRNRILQTTYKGSEFEFLTLEKLSTLSREEVFLYLAKKKAFTERDEVYGSYHSYAPEERLANVQAFDVVADVIRGLNYLDGGKLSQFDYDYRYWALDDLLEPYKEPEDLNPTGMYFDLMKLEGPDLSMEAVKSLSFKERFELGLPITPQEFERLEGVKDCLDKRISLYKK